MGGEIWARSEVHQGSQFHFTVRFAIAQEDRRPTPVHKNRPSIVVPNLHILVAEDNPANRILAGVTLKRAGFRVHEVENGRDAVDAVRRDRFDLVLMDCRMPVMDGYVATKHIRQLPSPSNRVPIIALTASAFKEDRERAEQAGMDDFLSKPFQSEELLAKCLAWAKTDVPHEAPPPVDFLSSLMGIFLETAPPVFENLLSAIESANWEDARSSAHWLRGGATRLSREIASTKPIRPALRRYRCGRASGGPRLRAKIAVEAMGDQHAVERVAIIPMSALAVSASAPPTASSEKPAASAAARGEPGARACLFAA